MFRCDPTPPPTNFTPPAGLPVRTAARASVFMVLLYEFCFHWLVIPATASPSKLLESEHVEQTRVNAELPSVYIKSGARFSVAVDPLRAAEPLSSGTVKPDYRKPIQVSKNVASRRTSRKLRLCFAHLDELLLFETLNPGCAVVQCTSCSWAHACESHHRAHAEGTRCNRLVH